MRRRLYDLEQECSGMLAAGRFNPHHTYKLRCPDCGFPVNSGQMTCSNCVACYHWESSDIFYITGFNFRSGEDPGLLHPVLHFLGDFAGYLRLKLSFFSKKCSKNCHFCSIPLSSSNDFIQDEHLFQQFEHVIHEYSAHLHRVEFVALGNEGSILDRDTFNESALFGVLERICTSVHDSAVIELEGRADLIDYSYLARIHATLGSRLALKIGLETHDEHLRNVVLGKNLKLSAVDEVFRYCGCQRIPLAVFIVVKPDYHMSDDEALDEGLRTIEYLDEQARRNGVSLMIRPNIMFPAKGTRWAEDALNFGWIAPSPHVLAKLGLKANRSNRYCYFGLWEENKTGLENTIWSRFDYNAQIFTLFSLFNRTQKPEILEDLLEIVAFLKDDRPAAEKFHLGYPL